MERIFKKDFKFSVDAYEEYQNQKCISSGDIDAVIYCHIIGGKAFFMIKGMEGLDIDSEFGFNVDNPSSQMLDAGGMVTVSRIQYVNDSLGTETEPFICHLFCKYGQIITIRFAFVDPNSSSAFPFAKKMYEFSGDMEELGELSEESKKELSAHFSENMALSFRYDKYCAMIETSDYNPLNIDIDAQMNEGIVWRSMVDDFEKKVMELMPRGIQTGMNIRTVIQALVFDHVETIFNRLGFVPKVMIDAIIDDIYTAVLLTPYSDFLDDIEDIKYAVYYSFTHR